MRKNQLVPPASVRDLEKGGHQHKALNDERVLPILYACPMIYLASPARDLGQGGAAINILFAQRLTLSLPLRGAALPWRHQGIGIKKARRKSRPSDCTAGEMFQRGSGDWKQYRSMFDLSKCDEIDLHFGERDRSVSYREVMAQVTSIIEGGLSEAQSKGRSYVMFIHGKSTSRRGKTTARSQVRNFMRSKAATPLIERKGCIWHETVFVAKIRPLIAVEIS